MSIKTKLVVDSETQAPKRTASMSISFNLELSTLIQMVVNDCVTDYAEDAESTSGVNAVYETLETHYRNKTKAEARIRYLLMASGYDAVDGEYMRPVDAVALNHPESWLAINEMIGRHFPEFVLTNDDMEAFEKWKQQQ